MPTTTSGKWRFVRIWCVIGLIDMVMVVISAQRVMFFGAGPEAMPAFDRFPFPMLPVFVVPLVLTTHIIILARLYRERP